ncbi:MAG: hypothetical protein NVSMB29_20370 [Candidatus Dormibacteria bacterium]
MAKVASPPPSTKSALPQALSAHARDRWPQLADLHVRFRGGFAYVEGKLTDGEVLPLCRLRYLDSATTRGFGLYLASTDRYEDQILPTGSFTGSFTGSPEEALDCACDLYLAGPAI